MRHERKWAPAFHRSLRSGMPEGFPWDFRMGNRIPSCMPRCHGGGVRPQNAFRPANSGHAAGTTSEQPVVTGEDAHSVLASASGIVSGGAGSPAPAP